MNQKQTNIEKGTEYELFINNSLNNLEGNISWLWSKIPELELRKAEKNCKTRPAITTSRSEG